MDEWVARLSLSAVHSFFIKRTMIATRNAMLRLIAMIFLAPPNASAWNLPHESAGGDRRSFLTQQLMGAATAAGAGVALVTFPGQAHAIRAIGQAEDDCRAAGNCLEIGEIDGALGWKWGAENRCDATDPNCGAGGKEVTLQVEKVPDTMGYSITNVADMSFTIGRTEYLTLKLGFYGNDAPEAVSEFLQFLSSRGLRTTSDLVFENGMGVESTPVSMARGGKLNVIVPSERLDFGVPLQSAAYARSKGMSKVSDEFLPQPRPKELKDVPVLRKHDVAGLVSVPAKGVGYGGSGFESDDECFESAFQITASAVPSMDKDRRVIGQVMDAESMATLSRLVSLPTMKGFKGVIPGQNSGPPLVKVALSSVDIQKM
jgi:Cyclophilin type peptidyl-prolyl cis-trans isomerase/CLD